MGQVVDSDVEMPISALAHAKRTTLIDVHALMGKLLEHSGAKDSLFSIAPTHGGGRGSERPEKYRLAILSVKPDPWGEERRNTTAALTSKILWPGGVMQQ